MEIIGIFGLVFVMWLMIILVSFFLIVVVAPLHISVFHNTTDRYITSAFQAVFALGIVIALISLLGKMKGRYLKNKLNLP
jgi:choline-glycine betaine transporter